MPRGEGKKGGRRARQRARAAARRRPEIARSDEPDLERSAELDVERSDQFAAEAAEKDRRGTTATALLTNPRLPDYGDAVNGFDEHLDVVVHRRTAPPSRGQSREERLAAASAPPKPRSGGDWFTETAPAAEAAPERHDEPAGTETHRAMRGLFGRDAAYLVVAASQAGLAALSIPITTRLLGKGFAVITISLAVMQVLVAVGAFSLSTSIQRNYRSSDRGRDARRTVTLSIFTAAITLAVAFSTGPLWAPALSLGSFGPPLQYAVIWAALTAVTFAGIALIRSRNLLRVYALISIIQSFVAELFSVLLVVFVHRTAAEFIFGEMLMQAVAAAVAVVVARPIMLRRRDRELIVRSLKYSAALVPAAVSGFLLTTSDRIIIRSDLPILQVARYGAVYNIGSVPLLLLGLLDQVWLPRFFEIDDARLRAALLADSRDALYRILIPVVLGIGFGVPLVLAFWVPHDYHAAGLVIVVLTISVGAFPMAGYISANRVLLISGRTAPVGLCMVITAAFNIGANIALIPALGIEGSALATSLAFLLLQILTTIFAHRVERLRSPPISLLGVSAAAVAVALLCTLVPASGVLAAFRALLTLACVAAVVLLLRELVAPLDRRSPWAARVLGLR